MKNFLTLLTSALILSLTPCHLARGQCLSAKDDLSRVADADLSEIQDFNYDLFRKLVPRSPQQNLILSPYSIWNALVLAYFGSAGETQKQFEQVVKASDKISTLRKWRQLEYM